MMKRLALLFLALGGLAKGVVEKVNPTDPKPPVVPTAPVTLNTTAVPKPPVVPNVPANLNTNAGQKSSVVPNTPVIPTVPVVSNPPTAPSTTVPPKPMASSSQSSNKHNSGLFEKWTDLLTKMYGKAKKFVLARQALCNCLISSSAALGVWVGCYLGTEPDDDLLKLFTPIAGLAATWIGHKFVDVPAELVEFKQGFELDARVHYKNLFATFAPHVIAAMIGNRLV